MTGGEVSCTIVYTGGSGDWWLRVGSDYSVCLWFLLLLLLIYYLLWLLSLLILFLLVLDSLVLKKQRLVVIIDLYTVLYLHQLWLMLCVNALLKDFLVIKYTTVISTAPKCLSYLNYLAEKKILNYNHFLLCSVVPYKELTCWTCHH